MPDNSTVHRLEAELESARKVGKASGQLLAEQYQIEADMRRQLHRLEAEKGEQRRKLKGLAIDITGTIAHFRLLNSSPDAIEALNELEVALLSLDLWPRYTKEEVKLTALSSATAEQRQQDFEAGWDACLAACDPPHISRRGPMFADALAAYLASEGSP